MNLNFDLSQLNNIDPQDVSKWPVALKGIVIILLMAALLGAGYWFDTKNQLVTLEKARKQEKSLKDTFAQKQNKAANLDDYREQMKEMKASFGTMLRQLPSETEVEDVLVDISQAGLANGLEFELFQPGKEVPAEFYAGDYHDFGRFVSDVAALPRIVTLHDFTITPQKTKGGVSGKLVMQATAKTYRYLNEE